MVFQLLRRSALALTALVSLGVAGCETSHREIPQTYLQVNLVSDIPGQAEHTDANLVNPWGVAHGPTSAFWVANNGTGTSTLYEGTGAAQPARSPLVVGLPTPPNSLKGTLAAPTGLVFNGTTEFKILATGPALSGSPASFLFCTERGLLVAWSPTVNATEGIIAVDRSAAGAIYKGLALAMIGPSPHLYATNFAAGTVEVFDETFKRVTLPESAFKDPSMPAGYAPFGIQKLGADLYVTYAKQNAAKTFEVAGAGNGFVDQFAPDGTFLQRLASAGPLDAPWGLTQAPSDFGLFSGALLVGNVGDGRINAYDLAGGGLLGALLDVSGTPVVLPGLWALLPGNGAGAGDRDRIYFTAGIESFKHGLFGSLAAIPQ